jgi:hypothetical protein
MKTFFLIILICIPIITKAQIMVDDGRRNAIDSLTTLNILNASQPDRDIVIENGQLKSINFYNVNNEIKLPVIIYNNGDTSGIAPYRIGIFFSDTTNNKLYYGNKAKRGGWILLN